MKPFLAGVLWSCLVAMPALAATTHVLVTPVRGDVAAQDRESATLALHTHVTARAQAHGLRLMARETYAKMVEERRVSGTCADLTCDVREGVTLLVDLVVSTQLSVADGSMTASVKLVDPRSGIVKAKATAEALTLTAVLLALQPAVDKALEEAFPSSPRTAPRTAKTSRTATPDARPQGTTIVPTIQFNIGVVGAERGTGAQRGADIGPGRQKDCRSSVDCGGSAFCKNRGDGRKVCMDDGAAGDFCSSSIDCDGTMLCKDRGDGFKVCM
jgi:hypothetical protein